MQSTPRPVIAFMTDFGQGDGDVGVLKGVVLNIAPDAHTVDITHEVAPQNIASGAWILAASYRYFPKGTVFVCVVDPGVGSTRHPIAVHAGDWYFVGPNNGLFDSIYAEYPLHEIVILSNTAYHLPDTSYTFHGRDIFAPVGAHIAAGVPLNKLGEQLDPLQVMHLPNSQAVRRVTENGAHIEAHIVHVDHFGNLITSIPLAMVPDLFRSSHVQLTFPTLGVTLTERRRFFSEGESDAAFIYGDSSGYVGVAIRNGNAAKTLGVAYGMAVTFVIAEK